MAKQKAVADTGNWPVTAKRYVGFIDIMGFKDMVARSTHEQIYTMMKEIEEMKVQNEEIKWTGTKPGLVRSTFYSDSIIIYSRDDSQHSAKAIELTLSAFTNDLLASGIPHKGALAFGTMTLDTERSIYFGQPLIDAYLLQEELTLYCLVVHASAEQELEEQDFDPAFLYDYLCPFKGSSAKHLTIAPIYARSDGEAEFDADVERLYNGVRMLRHKTSGHLRKYIDNTETYLKTYQSEQLGGSEKE